MIKVALFGKNSDSIRDTITGFNLLLVNDNPDVIVSYGGDGTLLSAERKFPGIPKLPIRDSKVCRKCPIHTTEYLLGALSEEKIKLQIFPKLEAKTGNEDFLAINDIVVRNLTPMHALRFKLFKDSKAIKPEIIIGDGVVATTAFGSTGYYKSITRKTIDHGFAIAFNNTTQVIEPLRFSDGEHIRIDIIRGPGTLSSDNSPKILTLREGDQVKIFPSAHSARIYVKSTLRCPDCEILRDKRLL